jgi:pyrimidine operon attenuation protein / uracil phosphoribosyltransferase
MQLDAENLIDVLTEKVGKIDPNTAIVGIHTGGAWVAERLAKKFNLRDCGALAVTLHRDDYATRGLHSTKKTTDISFAIEGRRVLLVDDVLQSGRTVRAAMNELFDFGRPHKVELAVLIDRGGRELPIAADYVAMTMPLNAQQKLELTNENNALRFTIRED